MGIEQTFIRAMEVNCKSTIEGGTSRNGKLKVEIA